MKLRLRYICGILIFLFFDIYSLAIIIFPSLHYNKLFFFGVGFSLFFLGLILDKKFGNKIEKKKPLLIGFAVILLLIAFIVLINTEKFFSQIQDKTDIAKEYYWNNSLNKKNQQNVNVVMGADNKSVTITYGNKPPEANENKGKKEVSNE